MLRLLVVGATAVVGIPQNEEWRDAADATISAGGGGLLGATGQFALPPSLPPCRSAALPLSLCLSASLPLCLSACVSLCLFVALPSSLPLCFSLSLVCISSPSVLDAAVFLFPLRPPIPSHRTPLHHAHPQPPATLL